MSERENQYLEIENPVLRRFVNKTADLILERHGLGSKVVLEGTPLYSGEMWSGNHQYGYNEVMPPLIDALGRRYVHARHFALIDELNVNDEYRGSYDREIFGYMIRKPDGVVFESHLVETAEHYIQNLQSSGKIGFVEGIPNLNHRAEPIPLRNAKGFPSCEVLDAHFQYGKRGCDAAVIIHPTVFERQQEQMRQVLLDLNEGMLPFEIYTILFRQGNLTKFLHTDLEGRTELVDHG